jgi:hypothetical protein
MQDFASFFFPLCLMHDVDDDDAAANPPLDFVNWISRRLLLAIVVTRRLAPI